ncbi:hypothetical protein [Paenibacillus agricola]|uniref:Uncharacterized protein n=1 Tax=Paenibacillus agricola TaxID=2716264 RepID=A0ABX0JD14_9BACL|nr:hypothetical protein [Paenibacillus agricola]NHN33139.1 hypothetical protein [Paenibacillus agricola]
MRIIKIVVILWLTVLVCIFTLPKLFHNPPDKKIPLPILLEESKVSPQVIAMVRESGENDGPLIGKSTATRERLQDVVRSFLSLINEGRLEEAGAMIDSNYLFDLMERDKPVNQLNYIQEYVHLFNIGEMKLAKITPPAEISRNMSCKVEIELQDGKILKLTIGLSEMTSAHDQQKQWYFREINRS